jgi:uncharacterized protein
MRPLEASGALRSAGHLRGMKLRDLALWVKSWNEYEAAMGLAAVNSAINAPQMVRQNCGELVDELQRQDVFTCMREQMTGKRVAVIGHFQGLERVAEICDLSILERRPQTGDFPDSACEYILQDQDVVVITGAALVSKTYAEAICTLSGRADCDCRSEHPIASLDVRVRNPGAWWLAGGGRE